MEIERRSAGQDPAAIAARTGFWMGAIMADRESVYDREGIPR